MESDITLHDRVPASASGRFILRLDPELHAALRLEAQREGVSLNTYCANRLADPGGVAPTELAGAVGRASKQFGDDLLAVVAYGSWARGEATSDSDIDLLIVLRPGLRITRSLYDGWDEVPLHAFCRPVEPSIVNLPKAEEPISGLWAEVSIDGVMLFDRGLVVSRHLAAVRRRILSGEITRRTSQGQPYWAATVGAAAGADVEDGDGDAVAPDAQP